MSESFEEAVAQSRETYGLLISGIDSMEQKRDEVSDNIANLFNNIFGSYSSHGIFGFQCNLLKYSMSFISDSSLMGRYTWTLGLFNLREYLIGNLTDGKYQGGAGGLAGSLFPEDTEGNETDFTIDLNQPFIYNSEYIQGSDRLGVTASDISRDLTSVTTPQGDSDSQYYSFSESTKESILSSIDYLISYPSSIDTAISSYSTLKQNTENQLATALKLEDVSVLEVPDMTGILSALNRMKAVDASWTSSLSGIRSRIDAVAPYSSSSSYSSELVTALNELSSVVATAVPLYSSEVSALNSAISQAMETASDYSSVSGFRKQWVYWILKAVDRPQSYRMDYNGAVQAIASLEGQKASSRYAVSLVSDAYEYLPVPTLNCIYLDPDTGIHRIVFTAIPCFDSIDLRTGESVVTIPKSEVENNSELSYNLSSIGEDTGISIRLKRTEGSIEEVSEYSNVLSLSSPSYNG